MIDTQLVFNQLKDFQKRTVNFTYSKLKQNKRFLVADEVGLGKTMIAKGVIAKSYDDWMLSGEKNNANLNVVYITTNQAIAAQNIETLKLDQNNGKSTKRLSLLITALGEDQSFNFKSFTVGTSLEFKGNSTGIREEREFLVFLLKELGIVKRLREKTLYNFFKGSITDREDRKNFKLDYEPNISLEDLEKFKQVFLRHIRDIEDIREWIQEGKDKAELIKELRRALVLSNLEFLSADLIILDEFQRFSHLLTENNSKEGASDATEIVQALFESNDDTKILLLSATPYKLLDCKANDHYKEFFGLLDWLYKGNDQQVTELKELFKELHTKPQNKEEIEKRLLAVMCRSERLSYSDDGFIHEVSVVEKLRVDKSYLNDYKKYFDLNLQAATTYIKSAPNPLNFMKPYSGSTESGYKLKQEYLKLETKYEKQFQKRHDTHPKLNVFKKSIEEKKLQGLIWMPPLHKHIKSKDVHFTNDVTKLLIFSRWDFTPDSIIHGVSNNYDSKSYEKFTNEEAIHEVDEDIYPYDNLHEISCSQALSITKQRFSIQDELEALILLAGPANCIYRSLEKYAIIEELDMTQIRELSQLFMIMIRRYDNHNKIKEFYKGKNINIKYILEYFLKHNIQSMFDEYIHLITDSPKFVSKNDCEKMEYITDIFRTVLGLKANSITYDNLDGNQKHIPSKFAMRIGKSSVQESYKEGEKPLTAQNIKEAFNSPFAPFVLATTSIGQEGLDFHTYCNQIWHWEIPSNPVDLEQREGRIHRYKNYAVRKNIAEDFSVDNWIKKFDKSKEKTNDDFKTFWMYEGDHKVQRVVPLLPYTKDYKKYEKLKRQLATYRKTLGHFNQKELMESGETLVQIDLQPKTYEE